MTPSGIRHTPARGEILRYLIAGGVNTAASYALYFVLLMLLPYPVAYSLAFIAGVALSYWLNARFVFHVPLRWASAIRFPLVSLSQFLAGLLLVTLFVERFGIHPAVAALVALGITIPMSFILTRRCMR